MSAKNIIFNDKNINKNNIYKNKRLFKIDEIDVNKIKKSYSTKKSLRYFIGYDDDVVRPLCIKLPQMIGYVKHFDNNKIMSFKVNDDKLFKKYTKIWKRVNILMNIEFYSVPIYGDNDKYIKTKIKTELYMEIEQILIFKGNKYQKKCIIQMFVIDNVRFCY